MDRSTLLHEAIIDGLHKQKFETEAQIIEATTFRMEGNRVIAQAPRHRLRQDQPATEEELGILREAIDRGLAQNGFIDWIAVEP